ncbi:hypothetical protein FA13DRAFT_236761 [Coprinellus micaceus]|uniref:Uncharacterized protein n=1 Tax=Coprinellus micaceus TaxID=71717 RepID=A0A4Y7SF00_COPMI|nr:hypothetical protein FA13DRAFT_236761 [Coprinellus micaceus]
MSVPLTMADTTSPGRPLAGAFTFPWLNWISLGHNLGLAYEEGSAHKRSRIIPRTFSFLPSNCLTSALR